MVALDFQIEMRLEQNLRIFIHLLEIKKEMHNEFLKCAGGTNHVHMDKC